MSSLGFKAIGFIISIAFPGQDKFLKRVFAVPGLTAALEALMRHPHAIDREDFVDAVDEADDMRIFTKVKGSMLDVHKYMVAVTGQAEKASAMGLIYDTLHYALKKPDAWLVMKLDWLMNKVKPLSKGEDLKALFESGTVL